MKTFIPLLMLVFVFAGCVASHELTRIDDEFYGDLASENNRIAATLFLDVYDGNLDSLTYDSYIRYLTEMESPSARGVASCVRRSDNHFFASKSDAFLIILFYKNESKVVGDNSETAFIDTVITIVPGTTPPDLGVLAGQMRFSGTP